jgi:hypothetical protein
MSSNSLIPFPVDTDMLPDGVIVPVAGSRKRKQAFSMNDPDNVELARLAAQAAKKKAKRTMVNSSGKDLERTHQKKSTGNCQPSNSQNVNESDPDDDDEAATAESTKKNLSRPTPSQNRKNGKKSYKKTVPPKRNRQPSVEDVEDVDDPTDNNREKVADIETNSESDDDDVIIVDQPAESAEEELS